MHDPGRKTPPPSAVGAGEELEEPPQLRRLRLLVSVLMAVLIVGFLAVATMLVIRLVSFGAQPDTPLADALATADRLVALGRDGGRIVVIVEAGDGTRRLRAFDAETGAAAALDALDAPQVSPPTPDGAEATPERGSGGGNDASR